MISLVFTAHAHLGLDSKCRTGWSLAGGGVDAEFSVDLHEVVFDGLGRKASLAGDGFVGVAGSGQPGDPLLLGGQPGGVLAGAAATLTGDGQLGAGLICSDAARGGGWGLSVEGFGGWDSVGRVRLGTTARIAELARRRDR